MLKKFMKSRGTKKFVRNKLAMVSLVVIFAYVALGTWVGASNLINDFIKTDENIGVLEERPVLGLFLRSRTAEEVGPAEVPGFGLELTPQKRVNVAQFKLAEAEKTIDAIEDTAGEESDVSRIIGEGSIGSRGLADVSLDELKSMTAEARTKFDLIVEKRRQIGSALGIKRLADDLATRRQDLAEVLSQESPGEDELFIAVDELVLTLEEFVEEAEGLAAGIDDPDVRAQMDTAALTEAAEALFDADDLAGVDPYPVDAVDGIVEAARNAVPMIDASIADTVADLEADLDRLYPEAEGFEGAVSDFKMFLGTDKQGRSILVRSPYSAKIAMQVGVVTALVAVTIGSILGAAAAFFGGWVDHATNWLYSMIISIPYLVLLAVLAFLFLGSAVDGTLVPLYVAFGLTYWTGPYRVIRGEALKIKELEYVQAATAIGFGRIYILFKHILPNTVHLMFINFSLLFIGAIKGEVILTFLGLGLKEGASWGIMISHSAEQVINGFFWQIGAATFFMFVLVLAFNIFTDALQDAFDPKHVS